MHWHDFTPKLVLEGAEKGERNSFAPYLPSGHPARGRLRSRQVSWLAGHNICSGLPGAFDPSDPNRNDARRLQLRGQFRPCFAI